MKKIYLLPFIILLCFSAAAQLVPCRPKICLIDYKRHDDKYANADKSAIQAARPDILIDNTPGGYYHGECIPSEYTPLGIQVFSYITGGYEGTRYGTSEDALSSNLARVVAIAYDGATGVFLDEVSTFPDSAKKAYISAIYDECVLKGLKLILNPGTYSFDPWLMYHCDYLMSDEHYNGTRPLSTSEEPFASRILVVSQGINTVAVAAEITEGANDHGFGYSYICNVYTELPSWLDSYLAAVTHAYAGIITGDSSLCATKGIVLKSTIPAGIWSSSDTLVASADSGGTITGVAAGTAIISYSVKNRCGAAVATQFVTVNPMPNAGMIWGDSNICIHTKAALKDTALEGTWKSENPNIATVDSNGVINGISAGIATITYSVKKNCGTAIARKAITVNSAADAGSISGSNNVCVSSRIALKNTVLGGIWVSKHPGVATVDSTGVVKGISVGVTTVSYTVTGNCGTAVAEKIITVDPLPNAGFITGRDSVCENSTIVLTSSISGGSWSISNGNASVSTAGVVAGITAGSATVSYTITNNCGAASVSHDITIIPSSACAASANSFEPESERIKIFPNPSNGLFTVELVHLLNQNIEITNVMGEVVFVGKVQNELKIDLSDKADGIYILRLKTSNYIQTYKILIHT